MKRLVALSKRFKIIILVSLGILCILITGCYLSVSINASGRTYDNLEEVPDSKYGILLGTSVYTIFGDDNPYFINRVEAAARLYKAGQIRYIICSGASYLTDEQGRPKKYGCDELKAMHDSLMKRGVPDRDITLDYEGLRTLNSIWKIREVYGLDTVTVISQKFHNERAIFQADKLGLYAVGYNAAPSPILWHKAKALLRELGARVKLYIDFAIGVHPHFSPKFRRPLPEEKNDSLPKCKKEYKTGIAG